METVKKQGYFPNLDGLRFIGASVIMILHIEGIKQRYGQQNIGFIYRYISEQLPVTLFFVLSGFLITYLLLQEKADTGAINMKKFFARRILRIWPLYYLIILLGFFVLPSLMNYLFGTTRGVNINDWRRFVLCILFLPNLYLGAIGATWSVRVEEMFYAFWPFLIRKSKNYIVSFLIVIAVVVILRLIFVELTLLIKGYISTLHYQELMKTINQYRLSCMAIGGMGAYLVVFDKKQILNILYRKDFQWALYITTALMYLFKVRILLINDEVYSVLFSAIIVNLATNPNSIVNLNFKWMTYLGKTSYGIYLFNPIMRLIALNIIMRTMHQRIEGIAMNLLFYGITIGFTLGTSIISYEFFEKKFLKLKGRFAPVHKQEQLNTVQA